VTAGARNESAAEAFRGPTLSERMDVRRSAAHGRPHTLTKSLPGARRAPYPGFIEPCLATAGTTVPDRGEWIHEIKHDGYRAQAHVSNGRVQIFTRNGYDWTARFKRIAEGLKPFPARQLILDGEVVVTDARGIADFHQLQDALARGQSERLGYVVFDLLYLDGFDLRPMPLIERKRVLTQLFERCPASPLITVNPHLEADASALIQQACAMHLEGIVSKERSAPYRSGRQDTWIKIKCAKTDTFPIVAFVEKLGASPRRIASLYLGRWDGDRLLYAGKAQTGFKHAMLYELRERLDPYIRTTSPLSVPVKKPKATWVEPALLAEVQYSAFTAEQRLRAPIFKGLREDLMAPRRGPKRTSTRAPPRSRVPKANILQLLPEAVVPTREQLRRYWTAVADEALPYLARRPLKLVRHDRGITFYHKGALPPVPPAVHTLEIEKREGGTGTRVWVDDQAGLLGLVDMGVIEVHPWNSTVEDLEHPDGLVLDLDPGPSVSLRFVVDTAFALRELLKEEGLTCWPKLTGGKGVHVMVPMSSRTLSHDEARRYSRALADRLAAHQREKLTTSAALAAREGRLFIDYLRNGRGTTAVGAFSPRARRGFPIAAPTTWEALAAGLRPDTYTLTRPWATPLRRRVRAATRPQRAVSKPSHEKPRTPATARRLPRRSKSITREDR